MKPDKRFTLFILLALFLFISACKVELYSNLQEKEATEMLAILLERGIDTDKKAGKEMTYTLLVNKNDIARAVDILHRSGFPRDKFVNIGEVFKKEGLVSSPLEERVRFIFALSQEISETLSKIDGVLAARVHVVIPENNPLSDAIKPSSASVFIKHRADSDVESKIPGIKKLVVNSIEGLTYDKVTVVLFGSEDIIEPAKKPDFKRVLSIRIAHDSIGRFWMLTGALFFLLVVFTAATAYLILFSRRKETAPPE